MNRRIVASLLSAGAVSVGLLGGIGAATADEPPPGQSIPEPPNPLLEPFVDHGQLHAPLLNPNSPEGRQLGALLNPNTPPEWKPGDPVDPDAAEGS